MLSSKALLTVQEAAGYAMAPPADEMDAPSSMIVNRSLDEALRQGHLSAARPMAASTSTSLVITKSVVEPAKAVLKGVVSGWWHPKAHA
ncbi:MAG: hypothetical protein ABL894_13600 [Hyphomicrobium sp.]